MSRQSKITTDLQPDAALAQTARSFTADDRAFLDNQVRGCQQHLANLVLNGVQGTYARVATTSAALQAGDVVCLAGSTLGYATVTLATPSALAAAGSAYGVVLLAASPGARVMLALLGVVGPSLTGLAASSGMARVSSAGRVERVSSYATGDYPIGTIDAQGYLTVGRGAGVGAGQFPVTAEGRIRIDQPTYANVTGADALYSLPCFADVPLHIVYDHPGDTSGAQTTTYFLETFITDISGVEVDLFQSGSVVASNTNYAVIALMYDDGVNPPAALATCCTSISVGTNPTGSWSSLTQFTVPSETIVGGYVSFGSKIYVTITKVGAGVTLPRFRLRARAYYDGVRTGP